ncbi:cadherin domain-containing protein [Microvirga sp. 2MCAF35]|uniref:cadherin domain-containing protein n=1 Tax=Microvirga sp. 2MCAF35 TaxID=3232987 RepID=UPI003F99CF72
MSYLHFNGHVYEVRGYAYGGTEQPLSWESAKNAALDFGGHLAKIESAAENTAIFNYVMHERESWSLDQHHTAVDGGGAEYVWIGANDISVEGQWKWADGTPFYYKNGGGTNLYSNWGSGPSGIEPDNFTNPQVSPNGQNCGALALGAWPSPSGGIGVASQWNDIAITNTLFYVVEYDTDGPNANPLDLSLSRSSVAEDAAINSIVGTFSALDGDGDALTYTITDPTGTFAIENGNLVLKKALDFETVRQYSITVEARDGYGGVTSGSFTINVADVTETTTPVPVTRIGTTSADTLAGDAGNDTLYGLAGNDQLVGEAGDDTLYGGLGKDSLKGDAGKDVFVFDAKLSKTNALNKKQNLDRISDFVVADDTIHLAKSVFSRITKKGVLKKGEFYVGTKAHDRDDHVIYNKKTGALSYDADGNGAKEAIQFAALPKNLKMTNADFLVF